MSMLLQPIARDDRNQWPENFFLRDAHLAIDIREDRRNEPAVRILLAFQAMAAAQHPGAFFLADLNDFRSVSTWEELTAGPISTLSSRPLPTFIFFARSTRLSTNFL